MGGKGKKRREKNYKEAHGVGKNRLPPPPTRSSLLLDIIPSSLKKLMSFSQGGFGTLSVAPPQKNQNNSSNGADDVGTKLPPLDHHDVGIKLSTKEKPHHHDSLLVHETHDNKNKKKKKRKRKQADDLRFLAELAPPASKRKERKKKLLQERKNKHKKANNNQDAPAREEIKFGEVVQAPPKLLNVPKRFGCSSISSSASQERIRLRTIEAYRDQKKWASRPGLHLPSTAAAVEKQPS